jgi:hypothetical protein
VVSEKRGQEPFGDRVRQLGDAIVVHGLAIHPGMGACRVEVLAVDAGLAFQAASRRCGVGRPGVAASSLDGDPLVGQRSLHEQFAVLFEEVER